MIKRFGLLFSILTILILSACAFDSTPPVINGLKNIEYIIGDVTPDFLSGISAFDDVDGDISTSIKYDTSLVDFSTPGTYDVFFNVTDRFGNETKGKITVTVKGLSHAEMVAFEIEYFKNNPLSSANRINLSTTGSKYPVRISWKLDHPSVMKSGIFLSLNKGETPFEITYTGTFSLGSVSLTETFTFEIKAYKDVQIENSRILPFRNLTTEYDVSDGNLELFFEKDGEVPYVSVRDFFNLIKGFIDPVYDITFTETETTLTLFYQYYDEDEDILYDLEVILDTVSNTITTNDPGFYFAYVATTETNFGRHIKYVDALGSHYEEGTNIVYELGKYQMDIVSSDRGILIPFYVANQLFAGSSYYNVYYNYDSLFGIYSTPDSDSEEFTTIRTSSRNSTSIPDDLIVHNFHMLNFSLDYFYGLKIYLGIESFYELTLKRAEGLLSTTSTTFEITLRDLLLKDIDEPHTSYGFASYYNSVSYESPPLNSLSVYGQRFNEWYTNGLIGVDNQIGSKWGRDGISSNAWAASSKSRPSFWFLDSDKKSVVVSLDSFRTSDIQESFTHSLEHIKDVLAVDDVSFLPSIDTGSKFFYFKNSTEEVRILEMLVKGIESSYKQVYEQALISKGFKRVIETSTDISKLDGYFSINFGEEFYMVQVGYDETYKLLYISVANKIPDLYEDNWSVSKDIQELVKSDSALYLEEVLENAFNESSIIENIMLDITWNTGGNVGALYRVIGFMTNQPFIVSRISGDTNSKSSSHVQVVGVPEYHAYNWALLTSPLSFSAANSLATIVKENNIATVIGLQTGGGASSITPILLPVGSSFTMSSNSVSAYRRGLGTEESPYIYFDTEFGISPDIVISIDKLFDAATLLLAFK
jgi:hypothetical protein